MKDFDIDFKNLKTVAEAKAVYRALAKINHPDLGGDTESFKKLNNSYHRFIDNYATDRLLDDDFDDLHLELEKIIIDILHIENIVIEIIGSWVWVSGQTKDIKEILKGLGFKWASKKKMWFYGELKKSRGRGNMDIDSIKNKYGSHTVKQNYTKKIKG